VTELAGKKKKKKKKKKTAMNFLKKIKTGAADTDELAVIPSGVLYRVQPQGAAALVDQACLYRLAQASVRRTLTRFHAQLVVQRVYEEGEAEIEQSQRDLERFLRDQQQQQIENINNDDYENSQENAEKTTNDNDSDCDSDMTDTSIRHYDFDNEEEYDDDDDVDDDEDHMEFLLDEALELRYTVNAEGQVVVIWNDLSGAGSDGGSGGGRYEFVCDAQTPPNVFDAFDLAARRCQYERKYRRSADAVYESLLDEFGFEPKPGEFVPELDLAENNGRLPRRLSLRPLPQAHISKPKQYQQHQHHQQHSQHHPHLQDSRPTVKRERGVDTIPAKKKFKKDPEPTEIPEICGALLYDSIVSLQLFDAATTKFVEQLPRATLSIYDLGKFQYWLEVDSRSKRFIGCAISSDMNPVFNYEHLSFIFNFFTDTSAFSWLLKFNTFEQLEKFQESFMQAMWEATNQRRWVKVDSGELECDTLADTLRDFNVNDTDMADGETDSEDEDNRSSGGMRSSRSALEDYDTDEEFDEVKRLGGTGKNSKLITGNTLDRSFVVRDNKLGVFKQTEDNELEFQATIDDIKTTRGKSFIPEKAMLHLQDRSLILQDPAEPTSLYRMDLDYGKVVEEWRVSDNHAVRAFAPSHKYAQLTNEQTIIGASDTGLFRIDPRLQGDKLVSSHLRDYATPLNFTAIGSTEKGYVAVATAKGEIRLYDRIGGNAKTQIPAMGDPIIGIDVSSDGRWILATCQTYLLLIDAHIKDGRNSGQLGFLRTYNQGTKPIPRRLQIAPEHLAYMQVETGLPLRFTLARFNAGTGAKEHTIVSSSGPYVITWNMAHLLRGDRTPYLIKRYAANVADDNFKFGSDKNVIIALEDDVGMDDRRTFRRPNRQNFAAKPGPIAPLARSQIVHTAF
jgi:hypothetical protein